MVKEYRRLFKDFYELELKPLIPTTLSIGTEKVKSDTVLDLMTRGRRQTVQCCKRVVPTKQMQFEPS